MYDHIFLCSFLHLLIKHYVMLMCLTYLLVHSRLFLYSFVEAFWEVYAFCDVTYELILSSCTVYAVLDFLLSITLL